MTTGVPTAVVKGPQTAAQTPLAATGETAATDVQAGVAELDVEKARAGPGPAQKIEREWHLTHGRLLSIDLRSEAGTDNDPDLNWTGLLACIATGRPIDVPGHFRLPHAGIPVTTNTKYRGEHGLSSFHFDRTSDVFEGVQARAGFFINGSVTPVKGASLTGLAIYGNDVNVDLEPEHALDYGVICKGPAGSLGQSVISVDDFELDLVIHTIRRTAVSSPNGTVTNFAIAARIHDVAHSDNLYTNVDQTENCAGISMSRVTHGRYDLVVWNMSQPARVKDCVGSITGTTLTLTEGEILAADVGSTLAGAGIPKAVAQASVNIVERLSPTTARINTPLEVPGGTAIAIFQTARGDWCVYNLPFTGQPGYDVDLTMKAWDVGCGIKLVGDNDRYRLNQCDIDAFSNQAVLISADHSEVNGGRFRSTHGVPVMMAGAIGTNVNGAKIDKGQVGNYPAMQITNSRDWTVRDTEVYNVAAAPTHPAMRINANAAPGAPSPQNGAVVDCAFDGASPNTIDVYGTAVFPIVGVDLVRPRFRAASSAGTGDNIRTRYAQRIKIIDPRCVGGINLRNNSDACEVTRATALQVRHQGSNGSYWYNRCQVLAQAGSTDETQRVSLTGSPTGGSFTLLPDGADEPAVIPHNATRDDVLALLYAALERDPEMEGLDATGGPLPATAISVSFDAAVFGDPATMVADGSGLLGGVAPGVTVLVTTTAAVTANNRGGGNVAPTVTLPVKASSTDFVNFTLDQGDSYRVSPTVDRTIFGFRALEAQLIGRLISLTFTTAFATVKHMAPNAGQCGIKLVGSVDWVHPPAGAVLWLEMIEDGTFQERTRVLP